MNNYITIGLTVVLTFFVWLVAKTGIRKLLKVENYGVYRKREKQLKFEKREKFNTQTEELIHKSTAPILKIFGGLIGDKKKDKIEKDLAFVGWDKYLDYKTYRALQIFFSCVGLLLFFVFVSHSSVFAIILLVLSFVFIPYLLSNEVKDTKMKLLAEFPDFIRITQGYLSSGLTFVYALESSLRFLGPEWQGFITDLVVDIKLTNTKDALERFKQKIDLQEIREFVAIVVLALDQGGDVKDAFESQAGNIQFMLQDIMERELVRRNALAQALQPALLISMILAFALPIIVQMVGFGKIDI